MSHLKAVVTIALLSCGLTVVGCKSEGSFPGTISEKKSADESLQGKPVAAPPAKYEGVGFTWQATDGSRSGTIQASLPNGEHFTGQFHEITDTTTVETLDGFYDTWYGSGWLGPEWAWDGAWPYYDEPDAYIRYYTGRVVAVLDGDRGTSMRCQFKLDNPAVGMKGGGQGECQLSNGDRIKTVFAAAS
jgi:hypothetical protein